MTKEQIRDLYIKKTRREPTEEELNILSALDLSEEEIVAYLTNKNEVMTEKPNAEKQMEEEINGKKKKERSPFDKLLELAEKKPENKTSSLKKLLPEESEGVNIFNIFNL